MTLNPMLTYIQSAIDYIEDNIHLPFDADSIASHINISTSYLKKIFKSVTGYSLIEYARGRKLNHCLELLNKSDASISEIALDNGYTYEPSFSRAFKKHFGISPKHYRDNKKVIEITPKLDLSFIVELNEALIVKPVFKKLPAFKLAGQLHTVTTEEKFQYKPSMRGKVFYEEEKDKIIHPEDAYTYYGYTMENPNHETFYLTALKINEDSIIPEEFHTEIVPEQDYIVFKFIGHFDAKHITWEHLVGIWKYRDVYLEKVHGITERTYGYFEYINPRVSSEDYCELELYVPILH